MEELYLIAPQAHQYELSMLLREIKPFCKVYPEKTEGLPGIEILPGGETARLVGPNGENLKEVHWPNLSVTYQGSREKNTAKYLILDLLEEELPWGILTGVRPAKIAYAYLEEGKAGSEVEALMQTAYRLRADKAKLATEVAMAERKLLQDHSGTDISIYVGIPFCPSRCSYCSFISCDQKAYDKWGEAYIEALLHELKAGKDFTKDRKLQSFYMGGGTPTILDEHRLRLVLEAADKLCDFSNLKEVTVEAGRPDTITKEKLHVLKELGVTRVSINPQTMRQKTLDAIGRRHSVEQIEAAYALAKEQGFSCINMDFIVGLPGETEEDVAYSMEQVMRLRPQNLTIHTLAIKRASRIHAEGSSLEYLVGQNASIARQTDAMLTLTAQTAERLGMQPYYMYRQKNMAGNFENVGYSLPGLEGLYNVEIMEERQTILAFGAGSVSKIYDPKINRLERAANVKDVGEYVRRVDEMIERKKIALQNGGEHGRS